MNPSDFQQNCWLERSYEQMAGPTMNETTEQDSTSKTRSTSTIERKLTLSDSGRLVGSSNGAGAKRFLLNEPVLDVLN